MPADAFHPTISRPPLTRGTVLLMHGYAMTSADLSPFGASLGVSTHFVFPESKLLAERGGKTWWPVDEERRLQALIHGARDLYGEHPEGLAAARDEIMGLLIALSESQTSRPLILGGFSQGGMLACDVAVHATPGFLDALVLLSASRLAFDTWQSGCERLRGLPVFVAHGRNDDNLSFKAGEQLAAFLQTSGADVTWLPFEGGHEIPLRVWRELRRFLKGLLSESCAPKFRRETRQ